MNISNNGMCNYFISVGKYKNEKSAMLDEPEDYEKCFNG